MAWPRLVPLVLLAAVAALAPSQAAPPPDAFCVILIEGFDGMRQVRVTVDQETNLSEREQLFEAIDTSGDGNVTRDENDAWVRANLTLRKGNFATAVTRLEAWASNRSGDATHEPLHTAAWRQVGHTFHRQDHRQPWPVAEPVDLETQEVREARFDLPEDVALVRLIGGDPALTPKTTSTSVSHSSTVTTVIEYVVVRAPPGWVVRQVIGWDYSSKFVLDMDAAEVDLPAFNTKWEHSILFERAATPTPDWANQTRTTTVTHTVTSPEQPGSPRGSPAPIFAALALGLGAAAVLVRRRL